MEKLIVGECEYIHLPQLNLYNIDAKIDTGADSCAIHCDEIRLLENNTVQFRLLDPKHPSYTQAPIILPVYKIKRVKSSNGTMQERIFVHVAITLMGRTITTPLSLANRNVMKYPMLIGRSFLRHHFIVDVSRQYLSPLQGNSQ
ncbi:MAG: hypothetical protein KU37_03955 [Sulfuricurvum sp. PC08-66]|nr:MAG: hypothetical protein KU37_03955 [Sulfuricurvum sp. PC08-66]